MLLSSLLLVACNSPQRYQANKSAAQAWLEADRTSAAANLTGAWADATDHEWGQASLVQKGDRVSGTLGNYEVDGVVTGARVNLALKHHGWYYYSVVAVIRNGVIEGYYSRAFPPKLVKNKAPEFRFERVR